MTEERADGGQAFPTPDVVSPSGTRGIPGSSGMSLRDYIACEILNGMMGNSTYNGLSPEELATRAYAGADLMLAERKK